MPPKRKAPAQTKAAVKGKRVKEEPKPEPEDSFRSTMEALKAAPKEKLKTKIDSACQLSNMNRAKVRIKGWLCLVERGKMAREQDALKVD